MQITPSRRYTDCIVKVVKLPLAVLGGAWVIAGCAEQPELMPMKVGDSSSYVVTSSFSKRVEPVKVTGEIPVAGRSGFELSGPLGTSRLVWKGGVLYASQTSNGFFDPPIPLLTVDGKSRTWEGRVESLGTRSRATATLDQVSEKATPSGRPYESQKSVLTLSLPRGTIVVTSWFAPKVGLVQQEQHTNDKFVLRMEILDE